MSLSNGPNLGLLIAGDAGEAHYDELLRQWRGLDLLVQPVVISAAIIAEPSTPYDGDAYIVPTSATGADWAGQDGKIARFAEGGIGWEFITPKEGWKVFDKASGDTLIFDGVDWQIEWHEQGSGGGAVDSVNGKTGVVVLDVSDISGAVADDDSRLSDSREWTATTVTQAEAEAGTATTPRKWTAQRVKQAILALAPGGGGGVPEAPTDGQEYARKNGGWVVVSGGGGGVAGDDKEVQFNDGGVMGASPRLTFDKNTPTLHIKHTTGGGPPARLRIGTDYQYNGMYFQSSDGGSRQEFQIALSTDGGATDYRRILTVVDSSYVESSYNFVNANYNNFANVSAYQYYSQIEGNYDETPGGGTAQSAFALQSRNSYSRLQMNFNNGKANNTASLLVQPSNVQFQLKNAVKNTSASLTAVSFVAQFEAKLEGDFGYAVGGYVNPGGAEVTAKKSDNSNKASLIHTAGGETQLLLTAPQTPSSSSATGTKGTIVWDDGFVYVCVDANTWKRAALSTW